MLPLGAHVFDHLASIENKGQVQSIKNIDFIYLINLDERPEKYNLCLEQLQPFNITPHRVSAINGWKLNLDTINDIGIKCSLDTQTSLMGTFYGDDFNMKHEPIKNNGRTYFSHCMSRGAIGIVLSHLSIIKDAYDSGYGTIWVMEDDIQIIKDPRSISTLIEELDFIVGYENWDFLFTDKDTKMNSGEYVPCRSYATRPDTSVENPQEFGKRIQVGEKFEKIRARYGAYSMVIRRSGMEKLLEFYYEHPIFLPYDMDYAYPKDIRMYCVREDIVSHLQNAASDNGFPNYLNEKN